MTMYEGEFEGAPTRKRRRRRRVRLDFSSDEALQKSSGRLYESLSPENLEKQVMAIKTFFCVFGLTKEGKRVFLGPFMSLHEADATLATLDDGEIFESKSRDLSKATRQWKAEMIRRGKEPDTALKRLAHSIFRKKK